MTTDKDYSAFPTGHSQYGGATLRDYFAAAALASPLTDVSWAQTHDKRLEEQALAAYRLADWMLAVRPFSELGKSA